MTIPTQTPSADLAGGKPVFTSHSSLALNCLDSNRLAVAAWLALFLLAARLDANDQLLMESPPTPLLQSGEREESPPTPLLQKSGGQEPAPVAHTAHHFTGKGV